MKLNNLKQLISKIEECDQWMLRLGEIAITTHMRDTLQGAIIERKNNLLEQLRAIGIEVEV